MTLATSFRFVLRWWWLLLLGALLATISTYLVSERLPRVYEANATLLVGATAGTDFSPGLTPDQLTGTYAVLISAQPIIASVSAATGVGFEDIQRVLDVAPVRDTRFIQLRFRSNDPRQAAAVINLTATTAKQQLQAARDARAAARVARVRALVDQLAQDVADKATQLRQLQGQGPTPRRDVQLSVAQSDLQRTQQRSSAALVALEDARVAQASAADVLTVIEPAVEPTIPLLPRVDVNVFSAGVVGVLLGVLIGLLLDALRDRRGSAPEIAQAAGIGAFGVLPRLIDPLSADGLEAFRGLRSLVRGALGDGRPGPVLITSPHAGAGTTTVAAGLAAALARAGERVILVDANLRRPRLARVFSGNASRGLTRLLSDADCTVSAEMQPTPIDGLRLLAAGPTTANSPDLLASHRMAQRMDELSEQADLVVVDAPSLEVSDPLTLLPGAGAVLIVLDARQDGLRNAGRVSTELRAAGGHGLALIVNHLPDA